MKIEKVTDGELSVLKVLWEHESLSASMIAKELKISKNWNKNTSYTFINRLVEKGIIERSEPNFICRCVFSKDEITLSETKSFLNKMFDGSIDLLLANFVDNEKLSAKELNIISDIINKKR